MWYKACKYKAFMPLQQTTNNFNSFVVNSFPSDTWVLKKKQFKLSSLCKVISYSLKQITVVQCPLLYESKNHQ